MAHTIATLIAVAGGAILSKYISEKVIGYEPRHHQTSYHIVNKSKYHKNDNSNSNSNNNNGRRRQWRLFINQGGGSFDSDANRPYHSTGTLADRCLSFSRSRHWLVFFDVGDKGKRASQGHDGSLAQCSNRPQNSSTTIRKLSPSASPGSTNDNYDKEVALWCQSDKREIAVLCHQAASLRSSHFAWSGGLSCWTELPEVVCHDPAED